MEQQRNTEGQGDIETGCQPETPIDTVQGRIEQTLAPSLIAGTKTGRQCKRLDGTGES